MNANFGFQIKKNNWRMKKIYFMFLFVFFAGSLVAQQATNPTTENNSKASISTSVVKSGTTTTTVSEATTGANARTTIVQDNSNLIFTNTPDNPGPVYINTGNVDEDTKNYVKAKEAWIKENTISKDDAVTPK